MQFDLQDTHQLSPLLKWYLRHKFIVQWSLFTRPNGKLIQRGKVIFKRTIYLHYLCIYRTYVTNYLLGCTERKFVKFGGPHLQWRLQNSFLTIFEHSSSAPSSTLYIHSTYRRLITRSEILKRLNFSLSKLILWRSISGRNFTYFNEQVSFPSSVSMCVGFKFACTFFCALGAGGKEGALGE